MKIKILPILKWIGTTLVTAALQEGLGRIAQSTVAKPAPAEPAPTVSLRPILDVITTVEGDTAKIAGLKIDSLNAG